MTLRAGKVLSAASWRHALAEIAFIVIGVLIAVAMNAWWQGRQDRERERGYLLELLADTRANERSFTVAIMRDSIVRDRLHHMLQVFRSRMPLPPSDSMVLWHRWSGTDYAPFTGAYEVLLQTGDLRLIQNDSVRIAATTLATLIDGSRVIFQGHTDRFNDLILKRTERMVAHLPKKAETVPIDPSGSAWFHDVDWTTYRDDPVAQVAFQTLTLSKNNSLARLNLLRTRTRAFRLLLERELGVHAPPDSSAASRPTSMR